MQRATWSLIAGGAMIGAGLLLLMTQFGVAAPFLPLFWAAMIGGAGLVLLMVRVTDAERWWALIPASAMLAVATLLGLQFVAPVLAAQFGGLVVLGGLALGFWAIALWHSERWWAMIPAGVMSTLAVITVASSVIDPNWIGAIFFAGFALTFGLVFALAPAEQPRRWALYPAGIMLLMSLVVISANGMLVNIWWIGLILAGLYLMLRSVRQAHA